MKQYPALAREASSDYAGLDLGDFCKRINHAWRSLGFEVNARVVKKKVTFYDRRLKRAITVPSEEIETDTARGMPI